MKSARGAATRHGKRRGHAKALEGGLSRESVKPPTPQGSARLVRRWDLEVCRSAPDSGEPTAARRYQVVNHLPPPLGMPSGQPTGFPSSDAASHLESRAAFCGQYPASMPVAALLQRFRQGEPDHRQSGLHSNRQRPLPRPLPEIRGGPDPSLCHGERRGTHPPLPLSAHLSG